MSRPIGTRVNVDIREGNYHPPVWLEMLKSAWVSAKANAGRLALGAVILLLLGVALAQAARLETYYSDWSLRYNTPVSGQTANAARKYAVDNPEDSFWPTFWKERTLTLKSDLAEASARCLLYSGEGDLVWPAQFLSGGWPGATDEAGCTISTALAWRLWGSSEVLDKTLEIDGKTYTVRGVFEDDAELCMLSVGDTGSEDGWQAVELRGQSDTQAPDVETFAMNSGLGAPGTTLAAGGIAGMGKFIALLPLILIALLLVARWLYAVVKNYPTFIKIVAFLLCLLFAMYLPGLLNLLPAWVIPSEWSDFSHWLGLWEQLASAFRSLLSIAPSMRDVAAKQALILLSGCTLVGCPLAGWLTLGGRRSGIDTKRYPD